jgi:hypothetical protein
LTLFSVLDVLDEVALSDEWLLESDRSTPIVGILVSRASEIPALDSEAMAGPSLVYPSSFCPFLTARPPAMSANTRNNGVSRLNVLSEVKVCLILRV